jgi:hypothetical protein
MNEDEEEGTNSSKARGAQGLAGKSSGGAKGAGGGSGRQDKAAAQQEIRPYTALPASPGPKIKAGRRLLSLGKKRLIREPTVRQSVRAGSCAATPALLLLRCFILSCKLHSFACRASDLAS